MKTLTFIFIVAAVLNTGANSTLAREAEPENPSFSTVYSASNQFGYNVMTNLVEKDAVENKNTFYSPVSASMALSMLYNGATGATKEAMKKAMSLENISLDLVNNANQGLISSLRKKADDFNKLKEEHPESYTGDPMSMSIANAIWAHEDVMVEPEFKELVSFNYEASVGKFNADTPDFAEAAASKINSWASDNTKGKIDEIVNADLIRNLRMLLANATYFKASWQAPFNKVAPMTFNGFGDSMTHIQAMGKTSNFRYVNTGKYEAIEIPYVGGYTSMYVIVPNKGNSNGFVDFVRESAMNADFWNKLGSELSYQHIALTMPKFTFEYGTQLKNILVSLGMGVAFTGNAEFYGLTKSEPLAIGYVKQQSFIKVDEKGTEAAAVTSIGMTRTSVPPPPILVEIDRPFVFAIRDKATGSMLFMGSVVKPEWK